MKLERFKLERLQSEQEHNVEYNLSESGVEPMHIRDLLPTQELKDQLLDMQLSYSQTNGTVALREAISHHYPGTTAEQISATTGGAEANFLVTWWLRKENPDRDELVFMIPNYMQIGGIWKNLGGKVIPFKLEMKDGKWVPDLEGLRAAVSKKTAAIAICTPNNPTGKILSEDDLKTIVSIAGEQGAWVVSDEIYRGAEIQENKAPSVHGLSDKVLITTSLSKAYGLPGLRIGWVVCPSPKEALELWTYSDYTTISPATASDWLATLALSPGIQGKIEKRTRSVVRENWTIMEKWIASHSDLISGVPPEAAAICFIKLKDGIDSFDFTMRLMKEKSVLISPGDHFEMPGYVRIGFGSEKKYLESALELIGEILNTYR
ncbi:MAG: aminotransferase class I/II-fold pyridoxal phosphate-dependent enzyme [Candidatus Thorarchaeota archaeon]|nr:aminotransferase class I/II-fold pyridoxal phosphate-dependent enzyme [Candidatus Thorarchaeota archaeon]